jgi:hypothetical protein
MSWSLKVSMLERAGRSKEEALVEVVQELEGKVRELDNRLAACFEFMTPEQIATITGDLN